MFRLLSRHVLIVWIVSSFCIAWVDAFVPLSPPLGFRAKQKQTPTVIAYTPTTPPTTLYTTTSQSLLQLRAAVVPGEDSLTSYFLKTLITNGVPAFFTILVIGVSALIFQRAVASDKDDKDSDDNDTPVAQLYNDLYGDQLQSTSRGNKANFIQKLLSTMTNNNKLPANTGIPAMEYLKIEHVNRKYDSYQYSLMAATRTKAAAATQYRSVSLQRALSKAVSSLEPRALQQLLELEESALKEARVNAGKQLIIKRKVNDLVLQQTMNKMRASGGGSTQLPILDITTNNNNTTPDATSSSLVTWNNDGDNKAGSQQRKLLADLSALQSELATAEVSFLKKALDIVGPTHAVSVQTALSGGGAFTFDCLQDRPLSALFGQEQQPSPNLYVCRFPGDTTASQVANLREEVTAILANCNGSANKNNAQVLLVLQSGGGTVTGYGLAAAQLLRIKRAGIPLTIAVEQVAASGGYMMCCVADRIVASPFAVLGSIGVIADIPNVYERLKSEGIEFQTVTAGKYKRTLTPTKKVTRQGMCWVSICYYFLDNVNALCRICICFANHSLRSDRL
jgi:hypothetical protein